MSVDTHRRVEALMARAEQLDATGQHDRARRLYLEAAELEAEVFREIPVSRPRTRGIIAVSVVSLFWRAGALDEVARHAHDYLADSELPDFARAQLGELVASPDPAQRSPTTEQQPGPDVSSKARSA